MVTEIRIYYEGHRLLQRGFHKFFTPLRDIARLHGCAIRFISGGSGPTACADFERARRSHPHAWNILLKDSEGPDSGDLSELLCRSQKWPAAYHASIFWMAQMMESWFHADKEELGRFYGQGFRKAAMKPNPKVEEILKADLVKGLGDATKDTRKGDYFRNKTAHGPELLSGIDPDKVRKAAPNCDRIFVAVAAALR